jgi:hypothetical protein
MKKMKFGGGKNKCGKNRKMTWSCSDACEEEMESSISLQPRKYQKKSARANANANANANGNTNTNINSGIVKSKYPADGGDDQRPEISFQIQMAENNNNSQASYDEMGEDEAHDDPKQKQSQTAPSQKKRIGKDIKKHIDM